MSTSARHPRLAVAAAARAARARRHRARGAAGGHRRDVSRRRDSRARTPSGSRARRRRRSPSGSRTRVVIGSDTIVVVDGDVLGKPRDEARRRAHAAPAERAIARRDHGGRRRAGAARLRLGGRGGRRHVSRAERRRDRARTSPPASRWTRRARTAFRASARRSSSASTATTSP